MLVGRRYRLELEVEQSAYAERVAGVCRVVWNAALEQRRTAARLNRGRTEDRAVWPSFASQCRELAEAKQTEAWLAEPPSHCLQQTLRDLDKACRAHGAWGVHFRARYRWEPSFRFPDAQQIGDVQRLGRHVGEVKLPKLGRVRFRFSRDLGGDVRNVTVQRDGRHWYVTFCIEDHHAAPAANGLPPVGIDRGVAVPVATSDGQCFDGVGMRPGEQRRVRHLQRRLARQRKGSNRRRRTVRAIGQVYARVRNRRTDFCHQTAHRLTTEHGMVVVEDLRVRAMTASARGSIEQPGTNVRQKAGLNRSIWTSPGANSARCWNGMGARTGAASWPCPRRIRRRPVVAASTSQRSRARAKPTSAVWHAGIRSTPTSTPLRIFWPWGSGRLDVEAKQDRSLRGRQG